MSLCSGTADEIENHFVSDGNQRSKQSFHEENLTQSSELRKGSRIKLDPPQKHENKGVTQARRKCVEARKDFEKIVEELTETCKEENKKIDQEMGGLQGFGKLSAKEAVNDFAGKLKEETRKFNEGSMVGLQEQAQQMKEDLGKELKEFEKLSKEAVQWHDKQEELRNQPATEASFQRAQKRILRIKRHEQDRAQGVHASVRRIDAMLNTSHSKIESLPKHGFAV